MKRECLRSQRWMAHLDELGPAERARVERHAAACPDCAAAMRDEQRVRAFLGGLPPVEVPRDLERRLLSIPAQAGPPSRGPRAIEPSWTLFLLLAALLASLLFWARMAARDEPGFGQRPAGPAEEPAAQVAASPRDEPAVVARGERPLLVTPPVRGDAAGAVMPQKAPPTAALVPTEPPPPTALPLAAAPAPAARPGPASPSGRPFPGAEGARPDADDKETDGGEPSGSGLEAGATASPLRTVAPPTEAPAACGPISVYVFADLAAENSARCGDCDGRFDFRDDYRAREQGLGLPDFQIHVSDASGAPLEEIQATPSVAEWRETLLADGLPCERFPLLVELVNLPTEWSACVASGGLSRWVESGETELSFGLTHECAAPDPTAAPTEAAPTATTAAARPPSIPDVPTSAPPSTEPTEPVASPPPPPTASPTPPPSPTGKPGRPEPDPGSP